MFSPTARAHSLPCSIVRSSPHRPDRGVVALTGAGPCPDTYSTLPTRTAILYFALGRSAVGSVIPSSFRRASAFISWSPRRAGRRHRVTLAVEDSLLDGARQRGANELSGGIDRGSRMEV